VTASTTAPTVVLVHGAFADASGYAGVIRELHAAGITALAPGKSIARLGV
jgi:alpha-beta hydrolase superfamily lysophospholipase